MKKLIVLLSLAVAAFVPSRSLRAQMVAPGDVSMGHMHLVVSDIEANKKFWATMGGEPVNIADMLIGVHFGPVRILLRKGDPTGPAAGSTVNHFGFYVPNVQLAMAKWKDAGLRTEPGGSAKQGFVWTPDGLIRIEILEMPSQTVPIVFHHVHIFVGPDVEGGIPAVQAWYVKMFGGTAGKRGPFDTVNFPDGELTLAKSDTPTVPTKGRAIDHIGFMVKGLEAYCKKLEASGMKFDTPYATRPQLGLALAFITDPWGTSIELNEPLPAAH